MPLHSQNITWVLGGPETVEAMAEARPREPFDGEICAYLAEVSGRLLKTREYPDAAALGFWLRPAALKLTARAYPDLSGRLGRGTVFHLAPGNVAANFAYSLAAGLLSGNPNIVRLPSRDFPQVEIIARAFREVLEKFPALLNFIILLRYGHDQAVTEALSARCRTRLIWGGDRAVAEIRRSPLPPRALDLAFADRRSLAVIDAPVYLAMPDKKLIAQRFYNDTFLTDQNACSSPSLVVWLGRGAAEEAQAVFWAALKEEAEGRYPLQAAQAVDKLGRLCRLAAAEPGARRVSGPDNLIVRVELDRLTPATLDLGGPGGFFLEYAADALDELPPVLTDRCQTLSVLGLAPQTVADFLDRRRPEGVDRIVEMGRTLDFSLNWDGYDLIYSLTRRRTA